MDFRRRCFAGSGHLFGFLKCLEHLRANDFRALKRFEGNGELTPFVVTEVVVVDAG